MGSGQWAVRENSEGARERRVAEHRAVRVEQQRRVQQDRVELREAGVAGAALERSEAELHARVDERAAHAAELEGAREEEEPAEGGDEL